MYDEIDATLKKMSRAQVAAVHKELLGYNVSKASKAKMVDGIKARYISHMYDAAATVHSRYAPGIHGVELSGGLNSPQAVRDVKAAEAAVAAKFKQQLNASAAKASAADKSPKAAAKPAPAAKAPKAAKATKSVFLSDAKRTSHRARHIEAGFNSLENLLKGNNALKAVTGYTKPIGPAIPVGVPAAKPAAAPKTPKSPKALTARGVVADKTISNAVGLDAGNKSMRAAGRTAWNSDDFNAASRARAKVAMPSPTTAKPAPAAKAPKAARSIKLGALGVLAPVAAAVAAATVFDATRSNAMASGADASTATADAATAAAVTAATAGVTMLAAGKGISMLAKVAPKVVRALPVVGLVATAASALYSGAVAADAGYQRDGITGAIKDGALAAADDLTLGIVSGAASLVMSAMSAPATDDKTAPVKPSAPALPAPAASADPGFAAMAAAAPRFEATPQGMAYLNEGARAKAQATTMPVAAPRMAAAAKPSSHGKTESYQRIDKRTGSVITVQSYKTPKK